MTKDEIKALAAEYGFTLNQDFCDFANRLLKAQSDKMRADEIKSLPMERGAVQIDTGYVYADQLLKSHLDQLIAEGWRQCAKGQNTSQFCGQLDAAVLAEREACAAIADSYEDQAESDIAENIAYDIRKRVRK